MWASAWTHMVFHRLKNFESFLAMPPTTISASGGVQIISDEDTLPKHICKTAGLFMVIIMFTISASEDTPKSCV